MAKEKGDKGRKRERGSEGFRDKQERVKPWPTPPPKPNKDKK